MLSRAYRALAVLVLNTLLGFVVLNVVCLLAIRDGNPDGAEPRAGYAPPGSEAFANARRVTLDLGLYPGVERFYPELGREEFADFMVETHARPFVYEPFTQFRERPYRGRFVNVAAEGFRIGPHQGPWPLDRGARNVFVFGGSTTFGFKLPDDQTVPAHLERALSAQHPQRPVHVYNFGRGYYFSTQERVLFEQLLGAGHVPSLAVFIDGLNDFYNVRGEPELTGRLRAFVDRGAAPAPAATFLDGMRALPAARAAARFREWLGRHAAAPAAHAAPADDPSARVAAVIERYRRNQRLIEAAAAAHGVEVAFVWQPVPTYKYDLRHHAFADKGFARHELSRVGYPAMAALASSGTLGHRLVWCADIQETLREELYLDEVHYTPAMARRLARCIADAVASPAVPDRAGG